MGTPCHNLEVTSETKLYRLLTPGSPLFRPAHYDAIKLDDFAMGTNAIVAVISYTVRAGAHSLLFSSAAKQSEGYVFIMLGVVCSQNFKHVYPIGTHGGACFGSSVWISIRGLFSFSP